jgi:HAD superfamily hydrolase (TIGR01509 family)
VDRACLVLDFDGTILDTEESRYRAWAELWEAHGHQLLLSDWQRNLGTDDSFDAWVELERRLGESLDPQWHQKRLLRRDEIQAELGPRPGVLNWLASARALGIPIGIASSSPLGWVESNLERLRLRDFFSCVVCRDDDTPAKPDPTSYLLACDYLDADPSGSVAVEDSPHGVSAAVSAGLFTVAVPHGLTASLDLSHAHLVVSSLTQVSLTDALALATALATATDDVADV